MDLFARTNPVAQGILDRGRRGGWDRRIVDLTLRQEGDHLNPSFEWVDDKGAPYAYSTSDNTLGDVYSDFDGTLFLVLHEKGDNEKSLLSLHASGRTVLNVPLPEPEPDFTIMPKMPPAKPELLPVGTFVDCEGGDECIFEIGPLGKATGLRKGGKDTCLSPSPRVTTAQDGDVLHIDIQSGGVSDRFSINKGGYNEFLSDRGIDVENHLAMAVQRRAAHTECMRTVGANTCYLHGLKVINREGKELGKWTCSCDITYSNAKATTMTYIRTHLQQFSWVGNGNSINRQKRHLRLYLSHLSSADNPLTPRGNVAWLSDITISPSDFDQLGGMPNDLRDSMISEECLHLLAPRRSGRGPTLRLEAGIPYSLFLWARLVFHFTGGISAISGLEGGDLRTKERLCSGVTRYRKFSPTEIENVSVKLVDSTVQCALQMAEEGSRATKFTSAYRLAPATFAADEKLVFRRISFHAVQDVQSTYVCSKCYDKFMPRHQNSWSGYLYPRFSLLNVDMILDSKPDYFKPCPYYESSTFASFQTMKLMQAAMRREVHDRHVLHGRKSDIIKRGGALDVFYKQLKAEHVSMGVCSHCDRELWRLRSLEVCPFADKDRARANTLLYIRDLVDEHSTTLAEIREGSITLGQIKRNRGRRSKSGGRKRRKKT